MLSPLVLQPCSLWTADAVTIADVAVAALLAVAVAVVVAVVVAVAVVAAAAVVVAAVADDMLLLVKSLYILEIIAV